MRKILCPTALLKTPWPELDDEDGRWAKQLESYLASEGHALFIHAPDEPWKGERIVIGMRGKTRHAVVMYGDEVTFDPAGPPAKKPTRVTDVFFIKTANQLADEAKRAKLRDETNRRYFAACQAETKRLANPPRQPATKWAPGTTVSLRADAMRAMYGERRMGTAMYAPRCVLLPKGTRTTWKIVECDCGLCKGGRFLAVDELRDAPDEDQSPWRHVAKCTVHQDER